MLGVRGASVSGMSIIADKREDGGVACTSEIALTRFTWQDCAQEIMHLRELVAPELGPTDEGDLAALHFIAWRGDVPVAAVRANLADISPLDFEPILVIPVPDDCRRELVSLSRLVIRPQEANAIRTILRRLIYAAWVVCWERGSRASLVSATEEMIPYYRRVNGCTVVSRARPHPRTQRPVRILKHVPELGGPTVFDAVAGLPGTPASVEVLAWLQALEESDA